MNNINFDNPLLLLLIIPMLLLITIPFILAVKKENLNFHNLTSYICHIVICILLTLVIAHTTYETVITETNVYVLADCSYSSNINLDTVDEYIVDLEENLPKNSKLGIICFGADYEILTPLGEEIKSVKDNNIDESGTNIVNVLEYTASLFTEDVIKRIVLISDGKETNKSNVVSLVDSLQEENIYIDAIYIDNNMSSDIPEVQISGVDFTPTTYKDINETAYVTIQSSYENNAILSLYANDGVEPVLEKAIKLHEGYNNIDFELDTSVDGEYNYRFVLDTESDTNKYNNEFIFTQKVVSNVKVLHITDVGSVWANAENYYGENIDKFLTGRQNTQKEIIPYTIEELCDYDIIILEDIDVRNINNVDQFLTNLDMVVSEFGKTLLTVGNTYIQNNDDVEELQRLSAMLPTNFGNKNADKKLLSIALDKSNSLMMLNEFQMAKDAACALIDLLNVGDMVHVVGFAGGTSTIQTVTELDDIEKIKANIQSQTLENGTYIAEALGASYNAIKSYDDYAKIVYLISDGEPHMSNEESSYNSTRDLVSCGAVVSTINISATNNYYGKSVLTNITNIGGGTYYECDKLDELKDLINKDVADTLTETFITGDIKVNINRKNDELLDNIDNVNNVGGYYFNQIKSSSITVLTANYVSLTNKEYLSSLYSYWKYGNGKVASLSVPTTFDCLNNWSGQIFDNLIETNVPDERINTPFIFDYESVGTSTKIIVDAPSINTNSLLTVEIIMPDQSVINKTLVFDSENYYTNIETSMVGKYVINLNYTLGNLNYNESYVLNVSYLPEYDSFVIYDSSDLFQMVTDNGIVSEDGNLVIENDDSFIITYLYDFTPLFMIIGVCLFVIDVIIRKLKWKDITTLFSKRKKMDGGK